MHHPVLVFRSVFNTVTTFFISETCNHLRGVEFFSSTILPAGDCCEATKCSNFRKFEMGQCDNNPKRKMGFSSKIEDGPDGKYYLTTGSSDPYCGTFKPVFDLANLFARAEKKAT